MKLSIIIPAYQAEAHLPRLLGSIVPPGEHELEVIVVDDGSRDGTVAVAREAGCRVVRMGRNLGPAAARNAGARVASGEIFVFTDADIEFFPDTLLRVLGAFEAHPECGAVVGTLSTEPVAPDWLSRYKNLYMAYSYRKAGPWVTVTFTSLTAVRAAAFRDCGGMPDVYPNEDRAFGIALSRRGHRIRLEHDLQVRHHHVYGWLEFARMELQRARNIVRLTLETRLLGGGPMKEHVPWEFTGAALCVAGAWAGMLFAPTLGPVGVGLTIGGLLGAGLCLWPFFRFLREHGGLGFAVAGYPLALADLSLVLLGALSAWEGFLKGPLVAPERVARSCPM